jgi:hypothetical protein
MPSTFTPFSRRFTNEREREISEVRSLFDRVKPAHDAFAQTPDSIVRRVYREFFEGYPDHLVRPLVEAAYTLVRGERYIWELPELDLPQLDLKQLVDYRNFLLYKEYFFVNQDKLVQLMHEGLVVTLYGFLREAPELENPSPFTIPLAYALPSAKMRIDEIGGSLEADYAPKGLFRSVTAQLVRNLCLASGIDPAADTGAKPYKPARESVLPLDKLVETYLAGTPYEALMRIPTPLKFTHEERFDHTHIVGGTGAGKTTLLKHLILNDIESDDPPSLVIVDPHGELIDTFLHADLGIEERLIYINPRDIEHPPALNVFALDRDRMGAYDAVMREQVTAGVIQTFDYLFSGLVGADLTAKQGVFFRYVARLMLSLPDTMGRNATILDMMNLMDDPAPYAGAIAALPDIPRSFFMRDFSGSTFKQTKEQIRYRLASIIENPTLARLFTSPETKVDIFGALNRGSIILVDTAKDFLKSGSSNFGRIFISLVLQAVLERAAIDERDRKDTFLIIDEAASYFDSNIDDLLTDARKFRCGCVFSHQYLDQASSSLRASLAANTRTKFASQISVADARHLAPEMRTTPDAILGQEFHHFACHIRGVTPSAVTVPIKPLRVLPRLSPSRFNDLIRGNRARVALSREEMGRYALRPEVAASAPGIDREGDEW